MLEVKLNNNNNLKSNRNENCGTWQVNCVVHELGVSEVIIWDAQEGKRDAMKLSSDIQVRAVMPSPIVFIYALNKINVFSKKKWNSQIFQLSGIDTLCVADCSPSY